MDLRKLKTLLTLMQDHGLTEMEVEEEGMKVRFSRLGDRIETTFTQPPISAAPPAGAPSESKPSKSADGLVEITSPMVGTFYRASAPGAEPFTDVGKRVTGESVVCIVEAMKVMNEIKAETSGVIREVCVENGEPVEFGQVLFRVSKE